MVIVYEEEKFWLENFINGMLNLAKGPMLYLSLCQAMPQKWVKPTAIPQRIDYLK